MLQSTEQSQKKQQQEVENINQHLKTRAQKFGSEYIPISLNDYKLYKIQKASETGKIQYLQGILLQDVQDIQARKKLIKQRTQKFFPNIKIQSDPNKFFNKRENPDYTQDNTIIRYDTWYLFGVDYMSNEKIRNYFHTNPHFKIQWINDSSCNITFNSKQEAEEAIKPYIKGDSFKNEMQEIWYQLNEYQIEGVKRKLFCRLSTTKDQKIQATHGHNSKYYRWELNKKSINNFVKKKAHQYINKQKKIKKQNVVKREPKKQEEEDSSSGVDDSEKEQKAEIQMKEENQ